MNVVPAQCAYGHIHRRCSENPGRIPPPLLITIQMQSTAQVIVERPVIGAKRRKPPLGAAVAGRDRKVVGNSVQAPVQVWKIHDGHMPKKDGGSVRSQRFTGNNPERLGPNPVSGSLDIVGGEVAALGGVDAICPFAGSGSEFFATTKKGGKPARNGPVFISRLRKLYST